MITQNPVIGRARKKLGNIYARTLYGKNILQSCPPPNGAKQTPNQAAARSAFGALSQMSNQVSASLLTTIYYEAPQGRSRRGQWCLELARGVQKTANGWIYSPNLLTQLGSNPAVADTPLVKHVTTNSLRFGLEELSHIGNAILDQTPLLIMIEPTNNICISLLEFTEIDGQDIVISPLSQTVVGCDVWLFPLWAVNVGTIRNPIIQYGSFSKS